MQSHITIVFKRNQRNLHRSNSAKSIQSKQRQKVVMVNSQSKTMTEPVVDRCHHDMHIFRKKAIRTTDDKPNVCNANPSYRQIEKVRSLRFRDRNSRHEETTPAQDHV